MKNIDRDKKRFKDIVNGRIKREFKRYIVKRELVVPKGDGKYILPMPRLDTPRFLYDPQQIGGVGQGEGEFEDKPADTQREHKKEVEVTLEELAKMLCESLQLPNLQNKGKQQIFHESNKYKSIARVGPNSLAHKKRTYLEALKRSITDGSYKPGTAPIPKENDFRYKAPKTILTPSLKAVVFYLMDVSGSMDQEKKEIVRTEAFWIDIYLRSQYKSIENKYIIHDATAQEVDQDTFYRINTIGGTKISTAIELADKIINHYFSPQEWNIYLFQFSDGDNSGDEDNQKCFSLLKKMITYINQYAYTEVGDEGTFKKIIEQEFTNKKKIALAKVNNKIACLEALKTFLGKGN